MQSCSLFKDCKTAEPQNRKTAGPARNYQLIE